jgi:hypothetical protein
MFDQCGASLVFATPFATSLVLALLLGMFTDAVRVDGTPSIVVALVACAIAAAVVSIATAGFGGIVLGIIGGASVIPIVLAIKLLRWPTAPVLGDGGEAALVLFTAYFVAAVIGAVAGRRLVPA